MKILHIDSATSSSYTREHISFDGDATSSTVRIGEEQIFGYTAEICEVSYIPISLENPPGFPGKRGGPSDKEKKNWKEIQRLHNKGIRKR